MRRRTRFRGRRVVGGSKRLSVGVWIDSLEGDGVAMKMRSREGGGGCDGADGQSWGGFTGDLKELEGGDGKGVGKCERAKKEWGLRGFLFRPLICLLFELGSDAIR